MQVLMVGGGNWLMVAPSTSLTTWGTLRGKEQSQHEDQWRYSNSLIMEQVAMVGSVAG